MEKIRRQVSQARGRMIFGQLLNVLIWTMFSALIVAAIALIVPKIWDVGIDGSVWAWSWIGGCVAIGLLVAAIWTYLIRYRMIHAAMEIDQRFGLKERVSSALALAPQEMDTDAGHALIHDAQRRLDRIDVRDRFGLSLGWRALLPIAPMLVVAGLFLLDDAAKKKQLQAKESHIEDEQQIAAVKKQLKQQFEQRRKDAEQSGLQDAEVLFKNISSQLDHLNNKADADRKQALVRLNNLKNQIDQRRRQLGDPSEMQKHLEQLNKIEQGPADRAAKAIKDGNFKQAIDEIKKLNDMISQGDMKEEQREELANQLQQMSDKLKDLANAHEQAKQELEEQIRQAEKSGDLAKAGALQQQLDRLRQQDQQIDQMRQMASQMAQASQNLNPANGQTPSKQQLAQAADALNDIASQLEGMQQQLDELQSLDAAMDQIAQAKNAMMCSNCSGEGCEQCGGMFGMGAGQFGQPGQGMNEGQGEGWRPEQETDTGHYWSRVGDQPQKGEAIRVGDADGANLANRTKEDVKQEIQSSLSQQSDPLTNQRLPRQQRDQAKQYFEQFQGTR